MMMGASSVSGKSLKSSTIHPWKMISRKNPLYLVNRRCSLFCNNLLVISNYFFLIIFRAKSPSFAPNPSMYSDALNASLQSALGFAENNLPFLAHSGASMASFHHHQQQQRERENADKHSLER